MHKRSFLTRFAALFAALLLCPVLKSALAQAPESNSPSVQIEALMRGVGRTRSISQVALSPDAGHLAWTESRQLFVAPVDSYGYLAKASRVTAATSPDARCSDGDPIWSPNSAWLAFFSDCGSTDGQMDLYISHLDSNPPSRITELKGYVHEPAFSPDGTKIAFLYVEGATRPAGALAAMKPPSGVIGEDGIEVQRVAVITIPSELDCKEAPAADSKLPLASRTNCVASLFNFVTPANLHAYEFDWSPDSKSIAYIAAEPPGENNWWTAKLYTLEFAGDTPHVVLDPVTVSGPLHGLQIAVPRWSPDGKFIAFIGGLMSDQGSTGGDVYVVSATGAQKTVNLTAGRHETAAWISWDMPGIDYSALAGGVSQFRTVAFNPPVKNSPAQDSGSSHSDQNSSLFFQFPASVGDGRFEMSLSHERGQFVFIKSSFSEPPEIWYARDVAAECTAPANDPNICYEFHQLSHFNDGVKPFWGETKSIEWSDDGFYIQGWLMLPANYDPHKKYPMIVEVHGGPAAAETSRWSARGSLGPAAFSALGYFVLMPNPRGSYGQGEAFTLANRKDFGYGDLRDILAGVDTVLKKYPVDPKRIGLTGWSYGGFMSMFAVTQTHRFRAAVAGAGISDWLSYYGENSIDEWMIPYFGASVYDDPAVYAKTSAINFIKNVTTPTLAVVGDRDGECPAPQSFEFWHALRDQHVPTELVVYPNEGHGFVDPAHRRDVLDRAVNWFAKYMPAN
ncbi:MAG: prolyl oligopeptidase family serine peptidase [Terracidiphilus sp.]